MSKITATLSLSLIASAASAQDGGFHCDAAKQMLSWLAGGPDRVIAELQRQPARFTQQTIPGWVCLTTPFPPERDGHGFVQDLNCSLRVGTLNPTDVEFTRAGEFFRQQLNKFYSCFGDDLINSMPKSYANTTRGEGVVGLLKQGFADHPLLIEYGYFRNESPATPIIWEITAGYSQAGTPPSTEWSPQICNSVLRLVTESTTEFRAIRRSAQYRASGSAWTPATTVEGASDCDGQTDRDTGLSVSCTMAETSSSTEASDAYDSLVGQLKMCLNSRFAFWQRQGENSPQRNRLISESSVVAETDHEQADGPTVRVSLQEFHRRASSGYEVVLWVDGPEG